MSEDPFPQLKTIQHFGECGNCRWFDSITPNPIDNKGICKRYPPSSFVMFNRLEFMQPEVSTYDYCGEYWAKE